MPNTTNYSWNVPDVAGDTDTWGAEINVTFQDIDTKVFSVEQAQTGFAPTASPTFTGIVTAPSFAGNLTGKADTADALATSRNISLTGPVTAIAVGFDGSANIAIATAIADSALSIAKTSGLQTALDGKVNKAAGEFTSLKKTGGGAVLHHSSASFASADIFLSTSDASGGSDGDFWFKHT